MNHNKIAIYYYVGFRFTIIVDLFVAELVSVMSSAERLKELSKPPARRMVRNSETESSDVENYLGSSRRKVFRF